MASDSEQGVAAPQDPEKARAAALFRSLGMTQSQAAEAAGVSERTVRAWEHSEWWAEELRAVGDIWLSGVRSKARATLLWALDNPEASGALAFRVLERLEPALADKSGPEPPPVQTIVVREEVIFPPNYDDRSDT